MTMNNKLVAGSVNLSKFISATAAQRYALAGLLDALSSNDPAKVVENESDVVTVLSQVAEAISLLSFQQSETTADQSGALELLASVTEICANACEAISDANVMLRNGGSHENE